MCCNVQPSFGRRLNKVALGQHLKVNREPVHSSTYFCSILLEIAPSPSSLFDICTNVLCHYNPVCMHRMYTYWVVGLSRASTGVRVKDLVDSFDAEILGSMPEIARIFGPAGSADAAGLLMLLLLLCWLAAAGFLQSNLARGRTGLAQRRHLCVRMQPSCSPSFALV